MSLAHQIRLPKIKSEKSPLIVLLHGYGSNEADLFSFAPELPEEAYIVSLRAPHTVMYDAYAWYAINFDADEKKFSDLHQARNSREIIMRFLEDFISKNPIDAQDVTLMGFSQGAILSYAIALSYPEKIRRVVAMSGYLNPDIAVDDFAELDLSTLKIFASHGSQDQVIPLAWAQKAPEILKPLGVDIVFNSYAAAHGVAPKNFFDIKDWLRETKEF